MTSDVEQAVRDALAGRAARITPETLRRPELQLRPEPPAGRSWRHISWPALAGASVIVAVAAVLLVVALSRPGTGGGPTGSGPTSSSSPTLRMLERTWLLTQVQPTGRTATRIPASTHAFVVLTTDGRFANSDGVNELAGSWTATPLGFVVHGGSSTAMGYVGRDRARLAAIAGIGAVSLDRSTVTVQVSGRVLTLSAKDVTLTLRLADSPNPKGTAPAASTP